MSSWSVPVCESPPTRTRTTRLVVVSLIATTRTVPSGARVAYARRFPVAVAETFSRRDPAGAACANISSP